MNRDLIDNNFVPLSKFISEEEAAKLADEFIQFNNINRYPSDLTNGIVTSGNDIGTDDCSVVHNLVSAVELLCNKTHIISEVVGETVFPTYTFGRIYRNGCSLLEHVDRQACEISLTINLRSDKDWPIIIKRPDGQPCAFDMSPGSAVLYLGCIAPHWRELYNGQEYIQLFLHYVRSRGAYSNCCFDANGCERNNDKLKEEYRSLYGI